MGSRPCDALNQHSIIKYDCNSIMILLTQLKVLVCKIYLAAKCNIIITEIRICDDRNAAICEVIKYQILVYLTILCRVIKKAFMNKHHSSQMDHISKH